MKEEEKKRRREQEKEEMKEEVTQCEMEINQIKAGSRTR